MSFIPAVMFSRDSTSFKASPSKVWPSSVTNLCKCTPAWIDAPRSNGPRVMVLLEPATISSSTATVSISLLLDVTFNSILHWLTVVICETLLSSTCLDRSFHVSMIQVGVTLSMSASIAYGLGGPKGWSPSGVTAPTSSGSRTTVKSHCKNHNGSSLKLYIQR